MTNMPEEIKELYLSDSVRKNIRIHFPNGERADITNANIDGENFSFTESICSRSQLKFGLCEASVVKFTCVGVENIKGCEIEVFHEIDVSSLPVEQQYEIGETSSDVAWPYYRWPYGRFVVNECPRQSDMRRRKVVAYSKEINWDVVTNPLECAKTNGLMDLKYNSPYRFNVGAVVYSNVYEGSRKYISDVTACTKLTHSDFCVSLMKTTNSIQIGEDTWMDGYLSVYLEAVYVPITSNEVADALYWLQYDNALNVDEFKAAYEKILNDSGYGWSGDYHSTYLDLEKTLCAMQHGFFQYYRYDYEAGTSQRAFLALDNHRYVYPFVNYSDSETGWYDESHADYQTVIAIPYAVRIDVSHTTNHSESFTIRDSASTNIYTVNNLPEVYMEVKRGKCSEQSQYGYRVPKEAVPFKKLTEAYAEIQGVFGKSTRDGYFEFVKIEDTFGLYPGDDTYPGDDSFPSQSTSVLPSNYQSIWYDDACTKPYGGVTVTFTDASGEEISMSHDLVDKSVAGFIESDYQTYDLSSNYLIQQGIFTESEMTDILEAVAENIQGVQYMPASVKASGTPWIEAGDALTVLTKDDGIEMLLLRRTLKGIQSLKDNFESR